MSKLIQWIRDLEARVYRLTDCHPAWNVLTWIGHASAVWVVTYIAYGLGLVLPSSPAQWAFVGTVASTGFYVFRELEQVWHSDHLKAGTFWIWLDHAMDVLAPLLMAVYLT